MAKRRTSKRSSRARKTDPAKSRPVVYRFFGAGDPPDEPEESSQPRPKPAPKTKNDFVGLALRISAVVVAVVIFVGLVFFAQMTQDLPDTDTLLTVNPTPTITVVDAHGDRIGVRGFGQGARVPLSEMPQTLPEAVMAVEDRRFYHHWGIDLFGLLRAAASNMQEGHVVQGGSTITQQLAKILFLSPERTYKRKVQEAMLAVWLEQKLTKNQILEIYLNRVYLGAGTYGVEAAAQRYFGKSARDLTLVESALLAGLLKAPSRYSPTNSLREASDRTALVLDLMIEAGFITPQDKAKAAEHPARLIETSATEGSDYVLDWVLSQLPDFSGHASDDLIVETSIDLSLQRAAEDALTVALDKDGPAHKATEGALVAMTPDGAIVALVGGRSYADSAFNRATDSRRSPGSAFKPFVYMTAIEHGYRPEDTVLDAPVRIGNWQPGNYTGRYLGEISLESAFAQSINTVAARLGESVGRKHVIETAHRFGISSPMQPVPSLALGSEGVGLLELTGAYAPFANGGESVIPHIVLRIQTKAGKTLYQREGQGGGRVADIYSIGLMNRMMTAVVEQGTGRAAHVPGQITAGKTGTGQDHRDAWFMGFTAHMVAGVWIGNDDFSPMKSITGGGMPAQVFRNFMIAANAGEPMTALPGTWQQAAPVETADGMPPDGSGQPAAANTGHEAEVAASRIVSLFSSVFRAVTGRP